MAPSLPHEVARLRREIAQIKKGQRLAHGASVENAVLQVNDAAGSVRTIMGPLGDGTVGVQAVNGPPPPAPTAPILTSVIGGVAASWDGTFANGAIIPMDWNRVEVHASALAVYEPDTTTLVSTIETAQGGTVIAPSETALYVRLVARSASGTASVASATAGPVGPAPVVADDIVDGIVTTVKLADDAVTAAKVAVAAIDVDALADSAVTADKIAANSVQATHMTVNSVQAGSIAAEAVSAGKIAAGAVTTAKLDALAVTTDKIAANAITTGKIQAGAVDATAIAATAITGKTITGGTITGALIQTATTGDRITLNEAGVNKILVYDATIVSAIAELSKRGLLVQGTNGSLLWLDPNNSYPNLRLTNAAQSNSAIINVSENTAGAADLGMNGGIFSGSGFTDLKWRTMLGNDFWVAERVRDSAVATSVGGRISMRGDRAIIGYHDSTNPTTSNNLFLNLGVTQISKGRLEVFAPASSSTALYLNADSGHTGSLARLQYASSTKFSVDVDGNTTLAGTLTAGNIATGTVSITPSAAHTPTSALVNFTCTGTTFRGYATANTTVPGSRKDATPSASGVTGVSLSSVTSTSALVWVNRENTTATTVNWMVIGS